MIIIWNTTADPTWQTTVGNPKSSSLADGQPQFHRHAAGFQVSTLDHFAVPEGAMDSIHYILNQILLW
jgi:hypothetical protein